MPKTLRSLANPLYGFSLALTDHLPLARYYFQCPRHVLAKLAQTVAAAALARRRRVDHHPLAWQMLREGLALAALARKSVHCGRLGDSPFRRQFVFDCGSSQLFKRQRNCSISRDERSDRCP